MSEIQKATWKALGKIKDPIIRAYIENALEDQAEREKGCKWCNSGKQFEIYCEGKKTDKAWLHKCSDGWGLFLEIDGIPTLYMNVNICPMCGRDLRKPVEK